MDTLSKAIRTLADGNALVIRVEGREEVTVTLTSSAAGRLIRFSTDGGTVYHTPAYDVTSATQIIAVIGGRPTHVEVTGQASDTLRLS